MEPVTFGRAGKTILLTMSSRTRHALPWLSWDGGNARVCLYLSWAQSLPALLGELSGSWVSLKQRAGVVS